MQEACLILKTCLQCALGSSSSSLTLLLLARPLLLDRSYNDDEPPSPVDSPTANMNKHIFAEPMGRITLFETAPNSGSGNTGGNNIQTADKLDPKNPYILAHGILMFLAWGVFAPAGVAVAVFAKGQKWFPTHVSFASTTENGPLHLNFQLNSPLPSS